MRMMSGKSRISRISVEHDQLLRDFASKVSRERGEKISMSDASRLSSDMVRRGDLLNRYKLDELKKRKVRTELDYKFRLF